MKNRDTGCWMELAVWQYKGCDWFPRVQRYTATDRQPVGDRAKEPHNQQLSLLKPAARPAIFSLLDFPSIIKTSLLHSLFCHTFLPFTYWLSP